MGTKQKLEEMPLKKRLRNGYKMVIQFMLVSGIISLLVICLLLGKMMNYVQKVNRADSAVKICRIDVNSAARNIREMALSNDASKYGSYVSAVETQLAEVDTELKALKGTGVVSDTMYQEYSDALKNWGEIGYAIIEEIQAGNDDAAIDAIFTKCTPALDKAVSIALQLDDVTDQKSQETIIFTVATAIIGIIVVILVTVIAFLSSK